MFNASHMDCVCVKVCASKLLSKQDNYVYKLYEQT